jgi:hypothetical protein
MERAIVESKMNGDSVDIDFNLHLSYKGLVSKWTQPLLTVVASKSAAFAPMLGESACLYPSKCTTISAGVSLSRGESRRP